ncbi:hypothetical protein [Rhodalgimonas zhirmunskyi]|uniref:Uncharacterized protein n=1 Tax=Rhodalgimonas zhirmunskyi TaxID=2964767 RepID=A0AAJ1UBB8_9RHOB|nr:hypothetical protein [Rhodoalgimonas zhirmunskyi]MDQ2093077.1 hypothetical protein [Rhodoalgimonas zhirmunskyi]
MPLSHFSLLLIVVLAAAALTVFALAPLLSGAALSPLGLTLPALIALAAALALRARR